MNPCPVLRCPTQAGRLQAESKLFHALADPTRLAILNSLATKPQRVIDLCRLTGRAQPSVSSHLACLRDSGLIEGRVHGRETFYSITEAETISILRAADRVATRTGFQACGCPLQAAGESL